MFKKIVSNLPFSPAIVGQLGFYAKRLRKEELSRRTALIFVALALVVQALVVFQPPQSANATSGNDFVSGGLNGSLSTFLNAYDANTRNLRDAITYSGVTRAEIASAKYQTFVSGNKLSWGFLPKFSYAQNERQHIIKDSSSKTITTVYSRPLKLWNSSTTVVKAWVGHSVKMGWFAIMNSCGNLVTDIIPETPKPPEKPKEPEKCIFNPKLLASDEDCQKCPGNESIWYKDAACVPNISKTKTATNTSQGFVNATGVQAMADDQISYTISVKNSGLRSQVVKLEDNLLDTLEYSQLIDKGGGTLNDSTQVLSWAETNLSPNETQTRTYVVRLFKAVPTMAVGASEPTSYDCVMTNTFGNSIGVRVDCPIPKEIEKIVKELPTTGPTENLIFAGIVLALATYFYARSKLMNKEIRLIRRDVSVGTI